MSDDKKYGAYICTGCGLGERLDSTAQTNVASRDGKMGVVREHGFLCNAEGVQLIRDDLASGEVSHVVIAACSRRAKTEAFAFDDVAMARANLREGVIWSQPDGDEARETTQEMAEDYVRMACAEIKFMATPQGDPVSDTSRRILVVGGGVSGMTSALETARAGYDVTIVEKSATLGGHAATLQTRIPQQAPYREPEPSGVDELIAAIEAEARIEVRLNAALTSTDGAPGRFEVEIGTESGSTASERFGAIVMATGYTDYDMANLPELGAGKSPDVVDQAGFEALVKAADGGPIQCPTNGREAKHVVFVQCAGQRSDQEGHLPYCSGHCCLTSIRQAMHAQEAGASATVLFSDLRTPGAAGEDFYRAGQECGVTFCKGTVSEVLPGDDDLEVRYNDLILDEQTSLRADLVVLATGMVPNSGVDIDTIAAEENEEADGVAAGAEGTAQENTVTIPVESILNLKYRQGPDVPQLKHGFADSHFICFPYESRRTGIYPTGPVRRPMDMQQAQEDATGAALKAIQAVEGAALGRAAHPRSGDLSFPSFRKEGCTQCKRCTVECPFGAIDEDEQSYPLFNSSRCRRCGTCMGACPVRVISFENYSVETVGQQLKIVEIPDEFEEKPRVLILACENDAYPALDMAGMTGQHYSPYVRIIPVRCLGSVNLIWVTDALNNGYDGVLLMGCKKGDNYQCHFVKGSELAHERISKVDETLKTLSLEPERVLTHEVAITDIQRIPEIINDYMKTIEKIGLSPFKF
ncbi:MAG: heterodisulfide reductase [Gammaproteobacteria bacterium]|nr:MAG: heterodisulfide reductase [Gammaproteobacteria bacterium]